MKPIITILILFTSFIASSQDFAPIGAKWYVEMKEPFDDQWKSTLINESIRDTMLSGKSCKVIYKSHATIFNEIQGEYILCQEGDSIFHYIESLDSFNIVMDFGAGVGEYWESFDLANNYTSFGFERNYKFLVDSTGYLHIDNLDSLRVQYLSLFGKNWEDSSDQYFFNDNKVLIERIGFTKALLPSNGGDGFTDDILETVVRCYDDPNIGLIKLEEGECFLTGTDEQEIKDKFTIFPNPASQIINLNNKTGNEFSSITIMDNMGKVVLEQEYNKTIDIGFLKMGIYIIQFRNEDAIFSTRIVKSE